MNLLRFWELKRKGSDPTKKFSSILKTSKLVHFDQSRGKNPLSSSGGVASLSNTWELISKRRKDTIFVNDSGTVPEIAFRNKVISWRFTSMPSSLGIWPLNMLRRKLSSDSAVSCPSSDGMVPVRSLYSISRTAATDDKSGYQDWVWFGHHSCASTIIITTAHTYKVTLEYPMRLELYHWWQDLFDLPAESILLQNVKNMVEWWARNVTAAALSHEASFALTNSR